MTERIEYACKGGNLLEILASQKNLVCRTYIYSNAVIAAFRSIYMRYEWFFDCNILFILLRSGYHMARKLSGMILYLLITLLIEILCI